MSIQRKLEETDGNIQLRWIQHQSYEYGIELCWTALAGASLDFPSQDQMPADTVNINMVTSQHKEYTAIRSYANNHSEHKSDLKPVYTGNSSRSNVCVYREQFKVQCLCIQGTVQGPMPVYAGKSSRSKACVCNEHKTGPMSVHIEWQLQGPMPVHTVNTNYPMPEHTMNTNCLMPTHTVNTTRSNACTYSEH